MLMNLIHNICSEVTLLKLLPHLPGAKEASDLIYLEIAILDIACEDIQNR